MRPIIPCDFPIGDLGAFYGAKRRVGKEEDKAMRECEEMEDEDHSTLEIRDEKIPKLKERGDETQ